VAAIPPVVGSPAAALQPVLVTATATTMSAIANALPALAIKGKRQRETLTMAWRTVIRRGSSDPDFSPQH
jgi:hypothetical protein